MNVSFHNTLKINISTAIKRLSAEPGLKKSFVASLLQIFLMTEPAYGVYLPNDIFSYFDIHS